MSKFLRRLAVCQRYGIATSTLYGRVALGIFLRPIKLGIRMVAWSVASLDTWEATRVQPPQPKGSA